MKKNTYIFFLVLFLIIVAIGPVKSSVYAKEPIQGVMEQTDSPISPSIASQEGVMKNKSEYTLPYPGVLQDHPLYFLKDFRDKIIEMLIVDPARKSEFYLLQSDKWIASVQLLLDKNQQEMAQKVLDQSTDRMVAAIVLLEKAKTENRPFPSGMLDKLDQAIDRHLEVIDELSIDKNVDTNAARSEYINAQEKVAKLRS